MKHTTPFIFLGLLFLCCAAGVASAVTVTISPDHIQEGDTITISIADLPDDSVFALRMESAIELHGETDFTYQAKRVAVPFGLKSPQVTMQASPVTRAGIEASDGDTIRRMERRTDTGTVSISEGLGSVPAGTIDVIRAFGIAEAGSEYVDLMLELSGTKEGPDSGSITFGLEGITDGSATIIVLVDGSAVMNKKITIGTPTVVPTPTRPPSDGPGNGAPKPDETVSVSSLDGRVKLSSVWTSISGAEPGDIRIIQTEPRHIPDGWEATGRSYIISPETARFSPDAKLSFELDGRLLSPGSGSVFLASYADGQWRMIPSRIEGTSLVASISSAGQYCMMTFYEEELPPDQKETPELTDPVVTPDPVDDPVTPEPEPSAGGWVALIGSACLLAIVTYVRSRRSKGPKQQR